MKLDEPLAPLDQWALAPEVVHVTGRSPSTASYALAANSTGVLASVASTGSGATAVTSGLRVSTMV